VADPSLQLLDILHSKLSEKEDVAKIAKIIVAFGWLVDHAHELAKLKEQDTFKDHVKKRYVNCGDGEKPHKDSVPSFNVFSLQHIEYLINMLVPLEWSGKLK
jgi:hypothetical protein